MAWNLGLMGAAGGGVAAFDLLQTTRVSGTSTTQIDFSGLSAYYADYRHLQIWFNGGDTYGSEYASTGRFRLNGLTSNYQFVELIGSGGGTLATGDYSSGNGLIPFPISGNRSGVGSSFSPAIIDILDFGKTDRYKRVAISSGQVAFPGDTAGRAIHERHGYVTSTAAVSTVTIASLYAFKNDTIVSLYGLR